LPEQCTSERQADAKFRFSAGGQYMTGIIRVALYARVSSQQQADANTIDSQTQAILERIRCDGLQVEQDCMFCDEGYSGSELLRPALEALRDRVAASMIDRVYIHTPDRLARKYAHQALLLEEFSKHHCTVIFGDHRGLVDNPETNLLVQMQGVIAEYEREKILERTRRGRRHAAVSGNVSVFGRAPYGYQHIKKTSSGGKASWEIDPVRSEHVRLMFKLVGEQGYSLAAVCRELQSRGIKTAKGNVNWNTTSVHDILNNSAYHGQAHYGKQRMVPRKPGKRAKRGDPSIPRKAKVTENTLPEEQIAISVPAIVNLSLFEQVKKTMQENQKRQRERLIGAKHLLSGLTICGQCGSAYCGHHQGGQKEYFYYRCVGADKYRRDDQVTCDNRSVNGFRLEEYVWKDVCKLLQDPKRLRTELERRQNQNVSSESNLKELVRRVSQVRSRIDRLIDAYESGLLEKAEFENRIVTLRSEYDRESFALSSLRGTLNESDDTATAEAVLEQLREQVGEGLETASEELKRDVIKLLVRRVEIHREEIRLVYKVPQNPFDRGPAIRGFLPHCLERAVIPIGIEAGVLSS
jgi:site-specific DNA recombinase